MSFFACRNCRYSLTQSGPHTFYDADRHIVPVKRHDGTVVTPLDAGAICPKCDCTGSFALFQSPDEFKYEWKRRIRRYHPVLVSLAILVVLLVTC